LRNLPGSKFCSSFCCKEYQYDKWILDWKQGLKPGSKGASLQVSNAIRKFLFRKFNSSCSLCGWNITNPTTSLCPLEVHHIDGNAKNNLEKNLTLLCPNCHSLTANYKSLNKNSARNRNGVSCQ
jgi:hypothetical protein